jgi:hypothetical protein
MADFDPTNGRAAEQAQEDDRRWFQTYPHRNFRIRDPIGFEFGKPLGDSTPKRPHIIVKRAPSGQTERFPILVPWGSPLVDDDDASIENLLKQKATD